MTLRLGTLDVSEVFGPTYQGEGPSLGRRCGFIRLARCNLDCGEGPGATWCCDTPYTWRWDGRFDASERPTFDPAREVDTRPIAELVRDVLNMSVPLLVVSGGEPLSQRSGVASLARQLRRWGIATEVETNGTIDPGPALHDVAAFNVSPKLANSGVSESKRRNRKVLTLLARSGLARFKFVVSDPSDLDEVAELVALIPLDPGTVWIMAAGTRPEAIDAVTRSLAEPVLDRGWNLTTRLHVLIWGDERGR
jgi:7-carboxy-7-deazaguanine synthase